jgi:replicative DNA helicase
MELGKVQPHNRDLEEAILGGIMLAKDAVAEALNLLQPEAFYVPQHQKIFAAVQKLFAAQEPIDLITVSAQLRTSGTLESAGGLYALTQLTAKVSTSENLENHCRYLLELAMKRDLIEVTTNLRERAFEDSSDIFDLLDEAGKNVSDISEKSIKKDYQGITGVINKALESLNERAGKDGILKGVPSGFTLLDGLTGGFQNSDLVIVAGRQGMGKTAFMLSVARNAAEAVGAP